MGVTILETKKVVYHFDHEFHEGEFTLEADPKRMDAFVIEAVADAEPTSPTQVFRGYRKANFDEAIAVADKFGKDIWITDVPFTDELVRLSEDNKDMGPPGMHKKTYIFGGVGLGLLTIGVVGGVASKKPIIRRTFLGISIAGLMSSAYSLIREDTISRDKVQTLISAAKLVGEGEIDMDDESRCRVAGSRLYQDSPAVDLRNVVNAAKVGWLADHLAEELDRKPRIYMVYGAMHTGVLDYIDDSEKRRQALHRWGGKADRYLQGQWIKTITRWHFKDKLKLERQPEIFNPQLPELENLPRLPVEGIEPKKEELDRRGFFRTLAGRRMV